MLSFLSPVLLWAALLCAVPVLIHLISRRRARQVKFSAIHFVLRSKKRSARQVRLRQLLLLLLRTLIIAALAFAIAQPLLAPKTQAGPLDRPLAVAIVVDESASMRATLDGKSAHARSIDAALARLAEVPADVAVFGVACRDRPIDLLPRAGFSHAALAQVLGRRDPSFAHGTLAPCVARAAAALAEVDGDGERIIAVFSDLAAHAFSDSATISGGGIVEWHRSFAEPPPPNHAIVDVDVRRSGEGKLGGVAIDFSLARSLGPSREVAIDLEVGGAKVARVTANPAQGARTAKTLSHTFQGDDKDAPSMRLVADDDAVAFDNLYEIPLELSKPTQILIIDGDPQAIPFRDEVFYLENALRKERRSAGRLDVVVIGEDRLDNAALASARVVVLANVARLAEDATAALIAFVRAGGGLLITSGNQLDEAWYNEALRDVLPGQLRGVKGQALLDDAEVADTLGFTEFAKDHFIFRHLQKGDAAIRRTQTQSLMLIEPTRQADREVLMRFSNGAPALLARTVGAGRVLLLATTIDRDWSDFAIRPGFLPIMHEAMAYLAGGEASSQERTMVVGDKRKIFWPKSSVEVRFTSPSAKQTVVGRSEAFFDGVDEPGLYGVAFRTETGECRAFAEARFSAHVDERESDLVLADDAALDELIPTGGSSRGGTGSQRERALWPWLLLLAVAFFAGEAALVRASAR